MSTLERVMSCLIQYSSSLAAFTTVILTSHREAKTCNIMSSPHCPLFNILVKYSLQEIGSGQSSPPSNPYLPLKEASLCFQIISLLQAMWATNILLIVSAGEVCSLLICCISQFQASFEGVKHTVAIAAHLQR